LSGDNTGNQPILSYQLQWNNGGGSPSITLFNSLATTYTVPGLVPATAYLFRARARNIYGNGAWSTPDSTITASGIPGVMASITSSSTSTDITINWVAPATGSSPLINYKILLYIPSTGALTEDPNCDGTGAAITTCTFTMTYLATTYGFVYGDIFKVEVSAENANGWGEYSDLNTAGETVLTKPTYMNVPKVGPATTFNMINVIWDSLSANSLTGGHPITNYELSWNGTGSWVVLATTAESVRTVNTDNTLTTGDYYAFKLRAQNLIDWGPYSAIVVMQPTFTPGTPAEAETVIQGTSVKVTWVAPSSNGLAITGYKIVFSQHGGTPFTEEPTNCNGLDATVISTLRCTVPLTVLRGLPWSLIYNDAI
jgi:cellulose 1,4-beta-cellobiosidase